MKAAEFKYKRAMGRAKHQPIGPQTKSYNKKGKKGKTAQKWSDRLTTNEANPLCSSWYKVVLGINTTCPANYSLHSIWLEQQSH